MRPLRTLAAILDAVRSATTGSMAAAREAGITEVSRANSAGDFGAAALLSNHSEFDDAFFMPDSAAGRQPGEANPFEVGADGIARYFGVVQNCAEGAKIRAAVQ